MTELKPTTRAGIPALMSWVIDPETFSLWSGPGFRYPFTEETFYEDLLLERPSFTLWENDSPVGFGQCYLRENRRHLGRLVIAPEARGRGLGAILIGALLKAFVETPQPEECSLFVDPKNSRAAKLYRHMGFQNAAYPGDAAIARDFDYMTASVEDVLRFCASR